MTTERERIARIIDPEGMEMRESILAVARELEGDGAVPELRKALRQSRLEQAEEYGTEALSKADQILAGSPREPLVTPELRRRAEEATDGPIETWGYKGFVTCLHSLDGTLAEVRKFKDAVFLAACWNTIRAAIRREEER